LRIPFLVFALVRRFEFKVISALHLQMCPLDALLASGNTMATWWPDLQEFDVVSPQILLTVCWVADTTFKPQ